MYSGQIIYYYNKYYFIKNKLQTYSFEFNRYINNNYDYTEDAIKLNNINKTDQFNNAKNPNFSSSNNENKHLIALNNNTCLIKTKSRLKNHKYITKTKDENIQDLSDKDSNIIYKKDVMKRLYKKLAKKCHPDKVSDELLNFYFIESQRAMKEKNLSFLIFLLIKAKITININNLIIFIQEELTLIEKEIKLLTAKIEWQWGTIDNKNLKEVLINNYAINKKLKKKLANQLYAQS